MITLIYICYAPKDKGIAEKIYAELKQKEIQCWISSKDIINGQSYAEGIIDAIEKSAVVIFIYSSNANASPQIIRELEKAASQDKFIIPFKIDLSQPSKLIEYYLSSPYSLDATNGTLEDNIYKLEKVIKRIHSQLPEHNNNESEIKNIPNGLQISNTNNITGTLNNLQSNNVNNVTSVQDNQFDETMLLDEPIKQVKQVDSNIQNIQKNQNIPSKKQTEPTKKSKSKVLVATGILA